MSKKKTIVNAARQIDSHGGISSVALNLTRQFKDNGYDVVDFTLTNTGLKPRKFKSRFFQKLWLFFEIIWATTVGSIVLFLKYPQKDCIIISHNDFLCGQIYINHGLHKGMVKQRGGLFVACVRNPMHLFIYVREEVRHRLGIHSSVVCFSEQQKKELLYYYPGICSDIYIIPNGVDLDRFSDNSLLPDDFSSLSIPNEERKILFVGHEFKRKGLRWAIESLGFLSPEWNLIVIGGDQDQWREVSVNLSSAQLLNRVFFLGKRYDVEKFYRLADCFVLPADFEPWGLVAIEAIASGTPVVMTNTGSSSDFIMENVNGFFCSQDPIDIANKIRRTTLLESKIIKDSVIKYSWSSVIKKYLFLIDKYHV
ncbi:glycosyltransferase family 4 protein [Gynuella sp.]|uniref:glycosyltransferase family 4 protein n=1 Tax=Gynuella sp. TaxID=2969146 RepID=UPI003D149A8F